MSPSTPLRLALSWALALVLVPAIPVASQTPTGAAAGIPRRPAPTPGEEVRVRWRDDR